MGAPPLKMNQADVQTAISRTFRQGISQLSFNKSLSFSSVDSDGKCVFFLQRAFDGKGKYRVKGQAKLWNNEHTFSTTYNIEATICVSENDTEPIITFEQPLTANKL